MVYARVDAIMLEYLKVDATTRGAEKEKGTNGHGSLSYIRNSPIIVSYPPLQELGLVDAFGSPIVKKAAITLGDEQEQWKAEKAAKAEADKQVLELHDACPFSFCP